MSIEGLDRHLDVVEDPRCQGKIEHRLTDILVIAVCAVIAGQTHGGLRPYRWAVIASLIETCKLVGVEPRAYLADVISRIVTGHPQSRLDELLPWAYPTTPALKTAA
jgi:transposase